MIGTWTVPPCTTNCIANLHPGAVVTNYADGSYSYVNPTTGVTTYVSQYTPPASAPTPGNTQCPSGYTGTPPNCVSIPTSCPAGYSGTPPNCVRVSTSCPAGFTGTPPKCTHVPVVPTVPTRCPFGYRGTPPNCKGIVAVVVDEVREAVGLCPSGYSGRPPRCVPKEPPQEVPQREVCPEGFVGTPPACTPVSSSVCPAGFEGVPPNCTPITACPAGTTGTPPNCSCVPTSICSGNDVVNSCSGAVVSSCAAQCVNGACVVPDPSLVTWRVTPLLVRGGNTVNVTWEVTNVSSCSIHSTAGDAWNTLSGDHPSGPINSQTVFTLDCAPLVGSTAAHMTRSTTVNIIPGFQEK